MHKVLVLGAGLVSRPIVSYFIDYDGCELTVATLHVEDAQGLIDGRPGAKAVAVDVTDREQVGRLVEVADVVVSLVPFQLHAEVAEIAVERGVHLVTTSYVSPQMWALDDAARRAGVLLLNECGLDPGLDHMSAMRVIERVVAMGGRILHFESCTGGLPAPEAAYNPWRYKFSWSPRGALVAGTHAARYLRDGEIHEVPGPALFDHAWPYDIHGLGRFEVYPNRDSLVYRDKYGLHSADAMLRGTVRYPGWSRTMRAVARLGLLETEARKFAADATYADLTSAAVVAGSGPVRERVAAHLGLPPEDPVVERLNWAGLFDDEPLGDSGAAPIDLLAKHFEQRMRYLPGERDMIVMQHDLGVLTSDGRHERHQSQLIVYGEPDGFTATSRTVSWPAAIAVKLLLEGHFTLRGVQIPNQREFYEPILAELEPLGIVFRERRASDDENT